MNVATGGAQRNPWNHVFDAFRPEGAKGVFSMKRILVLILLVPVVLFLLVFVLLIIGYEGERRAKAVRSVNPRAAEAMAKPLLDYAAASDGRFPEATVWFEVARTGGNITSRQLPRKPLVVMAMNDGLSGVSVSELEFPYQTVLLFESRSDGPMQGVRNCCLSGRPIPEVT